MNAKQKARFKNLIKATKEADRDHFSMTRYANGCGTPACVLGNYASRRDLQKSFTLHEFVENIAFDDLRVLEHFGITESEARVLFSTQGCRGAITPEGAVAFLEEFLEYKS
jgi:hypothetical protein